MRDSLGREVSPETATLIAWALDWFTAEVQAGATFEGARRRFNASVPLVISYASAARAAAQADAMLRRVEQVQ